MSVNWDEDGYAASYRCRWNNRKRIAFRAANITALIWVTTFIGSYLSVIPDWLFVLNTFIYVMLAVVFCLCLYRDTSPYIRVVPYFERKVGDIRTLACGSEIARWLKQLDAIAIEEGVRTVSSFGFNDDLLGETLDWHDPAEGLRTVAAIERRLKSEKLSKFYRTMIERDLMNWRNALGKALASDIRFCVLLTHDSSDLVQGMGMRQGSLI